MAMAVPRAIDDLLRLAWQADRDGKPGLRDALLTLAVAEGGADDAVLAERCRRLLVARRPDHWYATSPTLGQALAQPRVISALGRLRATFPPVRVQRLLLRAAVLRGPYRTPSGSAPLVRVLEDLGLSDGRPRTAVVPFPGQDNPLVLLYAAGLLALCVLLKSVIEPAARDSRAA